MDTRRLIERWLIRIAFIVVCCTSSANTISAQTLHRSAPLTGSAAIAAIADGSGDGLMAAAREELHRQVTAAPVRVETRKSDSLLNGALIGAAAGVGSGLLLCRASEPWRNCVDDVGPMLKFAAIGAGIGMGIDALIRERVITSQSSMGATEVRVAPMVGPGAGGLRFGVFF